MRRILVSAVLVVLPFAAVAQPYTAINRLKVVPLTAAGDFEVIENYGEGPRGIWCAAASYARDRLGAGGPAELYVKSSRGRSVSGLGRTSVVFTLNRSDLLVAPSKSYSISVNQPGLSLPVGHAVQFCQDYIIPTHIF
ncbi:MAG: hypothetical protein ACU0CQ_03815 [Sulfitobacter sp.]|uniref:hypothetical protein n=1 Tax=Sulfitobacter sp. TaxID=1903071 RepID=UPI00405839DC